MKNLDIRLLVSESGLYYKDIAREMNITPIWLSRLMKEELSTQNRVRIIDAIESLKEANSAKQ